MSLNNSGTIASNVSVFHKASPCPPQFTCCDTPINHNIFLQGHKTLLKGFLKHVLQHYREVSQPKGNYYCPMGKVLQPKGKVLQECIRAL